MKSYNVFFPFGNIQFVELWKNKLGLAGRGWAWDVKVSDWLGEKE